MTEAPIFCSNYLPAEPEVYPIESEAAKKVESILQRAPILSVTR
jgi:hypothetical protein